MQGTYTKTYTKIHMAEKKKLTALKVRKTRHNGLLADGENLYLRRRENGKKTWVFSYFRQGKRRMITIGPETFYTLSEARDHADAMKKAVLEGQSPARVLARNSSTKTFKDLAIEFLDSREGTWTKRTHGRWQDGLMVKARPLHDLLLHEIEVADVKKIILPIWHTHNHTARKLRGMIETVLDYAMAHNWLEDKKNPALWKGTLQHIIPDTTPIVQHHRAMPYKNLPSFLPRLLGSRYLAAKAVAFQIMTASRGHMVRFAVWQEFDLSAKLWTIPAARMKTRRHKSTRDHNVPLTDHMIACLPNQGGEADLVFSNKGKPFSENTFQKTLKSLNETCTPHGFRSSFKDWACEETDFADGLSEIALAHKVGDDVYEAYRRLSGINKRRSLMHDWCTYLHSEAPSL